jgi:hypothetical protein
MSAKTTAPAGCDSEAARSMSDGVRQQMAGVKPSELFILGKIDDYGLTCAEFRLLCHIARRGDCWASLPSIATTCRMNLKTAKRAIKSLTGIKAIHRTHRNGDTLRLSLRPVDEWQPSPKEALGQNRPQGSNRAATETKTDPRGVAQKRPYKGSPSKGFPRRESQGPSSPSERKFKFNDLDL